jgi:hypothetical protein
VFSNSTDINFQAQSICDLQSTGEELVKDLKFIVLYATSRAMMSARQPRE